MKTFFQLRQELSEQLKPEHRNLMNKHKSAAEHHDDEHRRLSSRYSSGHPEAVAHREMSSAHDAIAHHINIYHGGGKGGVHPDLHKHSQNLVDTVKKHKDYLDHEHVSNAHDLHKSLSNMKEDTDAVKAFLQKRDNNATKSSRQGFSIMKTLDQIREEVYRLNEKAAIHPNAVGRLAHGIGLRGQGDSHNGHEGAEREHDNYADEHKGTAAGKFHAKASLHHQNALNALKKGNMTTSLKHAKLAKDAAAKAKAAGGEDSASHQIHSDHSAEARIAKPSAYRTIQKKDKSAARANPAKAAIGKAKSKVKKIFGRK